MYTDVLFRAINFATKAHSGQFRKGISLPYIYHPLAVGRMLIEINAAEYVVVAGILHDAVEDTSVTIDTINAQFGMEVSGIVKLLTRVDPAQSWKERKSRTIEVVRVCPVDALLVSCADKLDNIRAIRKDYEALGDVLWQRFAAGKQMQQWYYTGLVRAFRERVHAGVIVPFENEFNEQVRIVFG